MTSIWALILGGYLFAATFPSAEACAQYGRKAQLERGLPMNDFRCVEVK